MMQLLLSSSSLYVLDKDNKSITRRMRLLDIEFITISRMHAGIIVLHHVKVHCGVGAATVLLVSSEH
jgi:hypothetical protein